MKQQPTRLSPRGTERILYVSDPSSIATNLFSDPTTPEELRQWVDMVAESGVDLFDQEVFSQGWTCYWRSERHEYDRRRQHERFLPMLEAGIQPLEVLIDQSHRRLGMRFIAGFRMNDNHAHQSRQQGVGIAHFIESHPEWRMTEFPEGDYYRLGEPLDFTFAEVREFTYSVVEEVTTRFDIDGIEVCFRDHAYFPPDKGREHRSLMTDLLRRTRSMLDQQSQAKGKKLLMGARVFSTLQECIDMGLDLPVWVGEGLIDFLCPQDVMYSDFNAPYPEFAALTRASTCMLYPGLLPWSSVRARGRLDQIPLSPANCRALAHTVYGAGADGISIYNHFCAMWHAPFYPQSMQFFHALRDPEEVATGERHYVFDPTYAGLTGFGADGRCSTGALKANKVVLDRVGVNAQGDYPFWLFEGLAEGQKATLLFRGFNLSSADELDVALNGTVIPAGEIRRTAPLGTPPDEWLQESEGASRRLLPEQGRIDFRKGGEPPFSTRWFELTPERVEWGTNVLSITLTKGDPAAADPIVIDEVEVFVSARATRR